MGSNSAETEEAKLPGSDMAASVALVHQRTAESPDSEDELMASIGVVNPMAAAAGSSLKPTEELINAEFDRWLATPLLDVSPMTKPLMWWKRHGAVDFPLLAPAAQALLCVMATSADIERAFSRARFWTRDERGATGDDTVSMCVSLGLVFSKKGTDLHELFERISSDPSPTNVAAAVRSADV